MIEEGHDRARALAARACATATRGARPLAPAQDFKRIGDGDTGPNTGGMGAYSPVPVADGAVVDERDGHGSSRRRSRDLAAPGHRLPGRALRGADAHARRPEALEYNVRFGDPEAQVVLPRLATDPGGASWPRHGRRACRQLEFVADACVTVVLATEGYPVSPYRTGDVIEGLDRAAALEGVIVFHAGTVAVPRHASGTQPACVR